MSTSRSPMAEGTVDLGAQYITSSLDYAAKHAKYVIHGPSSNK